MHVPLALLVSNAKRLSKGSPRSLAPSRGGMDLVAFSALRRTNPRSHKLIKQGYDGPTGDWG